MFLTQSYTLQEAAAAQAARTGRRRTRGTAARTRRATRRSTSRRRPARPTPTATHRPRATTHENTSTRSSHLGK